MANIGDNTIFSPSVFSPGILGRDNVFGTYIMDDRNGTGLLEQPFGAGASAAYSLYDLGNQRGTVVESEGTYHNPVVRLRRDSDGTHKSFSGVEIGNQTALNWVNEDVVTYTSDFSAGVDGNAAKSGTLTGNVDGIGGEDDNLSLWADGTNTSHGITLPQGSLVSGNQYAVTFDVYIPSGQTTVDGAGLYFSATSTVTSSTSTTDEWVTITETFTYGEGLRSGTMRVTQLDTGTGTPYVFTGANSASDDLIYIRNVTITQLTSNAYATTWYDQSGQDNDATQATEASQPKVVDAGAYVVDANGNYSLSFDGTDDELVVANLVNEFENTDFQLTYMGSNVYAGLVSGSVPRLYFRDTAYSYDALSIIPYTNPSLALQTFQCVGSAHEVFHDGASVGTATQAQTAFGPTDFAIGQSAAAYRNTTISAMVFYASDKSTDRSAIEESLSDTITTALS